LQRICAIAICVNVNGDAVCVDGAQDDESLAGLDDELDVVGVDEGSGAILVGVVVEYAREDAVDV
jgi:hypothetical protein